MNRLLSKTSISSLFFAGAIFFCASCKQNETPPTTPPAPPSTNAPATNESSANPVVITPEDARNHIGETVIVRGKVDRIHVSQKGDVFIDMGGKHPNAAFTAVCFQQAIPTADLQKFNGKVVSVKGKVKDYNGKVEIVLEKPEQISE